MKILLFSDSHGHVNNMAKAISRNKNTDMVIHLGDVVRDILKIGESYKGIRLEYVQGNNDWAREYPKDKMLEIDGKRIFITHGHLYNVKYTYQNIISKGKAVNADAVFFGHTHQAEELFSDGMMILNPGSIGMPMQSNNPTYCIIDIKDGKIISRFAGLV